MGLFGKIKRSAKKTEIQPKTEPKLSVVVGGTEVVGTIPNAKMVSGAKYFQDELGRIDGTIIQVAVIDRKKTQLKFDDYAVVLPDMTPVGTLSKYAFDKLELSEGDVVKALIQRNNSNDGLTRLWITNEK